MTTATGVAPPPDGAAGGSTGDTPAMPSRRELANAIRALAMDAVQRANSGHPGMPMGMADVAEVLWNGHLRHDPADPAWPDRDRFVLSNGHGSMLLYALLHLSGYALPMEEIRRFRQLHSMTPGHPEYGDAPGVETTTGPLGQGLANAVGMAIAEKVLAARFNRDGHRIVNHRTWVFLGDGCLMEGISHEACSLAGTLGLGRLIAFYDDNNISIDGEVGGWFTDDTPARFEAYGWHVTRDVDGHDPAAVDAAIRGALARSPIARRSCAARRSSDSARRARRARHPRTAHHSATARSPRRAKRSDGLIHRSRSPTGSTRAGTPAGGGRRATEHGGSASNPGGPRSRGKRRSSSAGWRARCPRAGRRNVLATSTRPTRRPRPSPRAWHRRTPWKHSAPCCRS